MTRLHMLFIAYTKRVYLKNIDKKTSKSLCDGGLFKFRGQKWASKSELGQPKFTTNIFYKLIIYLFLWESSNPITCSEDMAGKVPSGRIIPAFQLFENRLRTFVCALCVGKYNYCSLFMTGRIYHSPRMRKNARAQVTKFLLVES